MGGEESDCVNLADLEIGNCDSIPVDLGAWTEQEFELSNDVRERMNKLVKAGESDVPNYLQTEFAKSSLTDAWSPVQYLRLGKNDPENAVAFFHETLKWRRDMGVDSIMDGGFPEYDDVKEAYPNALHGVSKFGNPVYIYCPGRINVEKMGKAISVETMLRRDVLIQEHMQILMAQQSEKLGRRIHQVTAIIDMNGLGMGHVKAYVEYFKQMASIYQDHYPDEMSQCFVINAPWAFNVAWAIVKVFLCERTRNKVSIMGADYLKGLSNAVDLEQLPEFLGGKCAKKCSADDFHNCHAFEKQFRKLVCQDSSVDTGNSRECVTAQN
eukprot:499488_1